MGGAPAAGTLTPPPPKKTHPTTQRTQTANTTHSFVLPSPEAWAAMERAAAASNKSLSKADLQVLFSYLTASPAADLQEHLAGALFLFLGLF